MNQDFKPENYDFIWKVDGFSYLQNSYWLKDTEYYRRDFVITSKNEEWKVYLGKEERKLLSKFGFELVTNGLDDFKVKVAVVLKDVREKFRKADDADFSTLSTQELQDSFLEMTKCVQELIGIYFYTEFFCYDTVQEEIEKLGLTDKEHLTSTPFENLVSLEKYERYKLAQSPTDEKIKSFLEKFDFVPYAEGKPRWTKQTLVENLDNLKDENIEEKIKEIEHVHQEIIKIRKEDKLATGVRGIQELKFHIRIFFNKVFFRNNIMEKYLEEIAQRVGKKTEDFHTYHFKEIIDLLEGKKIELPDRTVYVLGKFDNWKDILAQDALSIIDELEKGVDIDVKILKGHIGNEGYYKGKVKIIPFDVRADLTDKINEMEKGDVLVSGSTGPEMIMACRKAGAIITEEGGILSHAAIVSRELGIPAVIATKIATKVLKDGDIVEVDANNGIVKIIKE